MPSCCTIYRHGTAPQTVKSSRERRARGLLCCRVCVRPGAVGLLCPLSLILSALSAASRSPLLSFPPPQARHTTPFSSNPFTRVPFANPTHPRWSQAGNMPATWASSQRLPFILLLLYLLPSDILVPNPSPGVVSASPSWPKKIGKGPGGQEQGCSSGPGTDPSGQVIATFSRTQRIVGQRVQPAGAPTQPGEAAKSAGGVRPDQESGRRGGSGRERGQREQRRKKTARLCGGRSAKAEQGGLVTKGRATSKGWDSGWP